LLETFATEYHDMGFSGVEFKKMGVGPLRDRRKARGNIKEEHR